MSLCLLLFLSVFCVDAGATYISAKTITETVEATNDDGIMTLSEVDSDTIYYFLQPTKFTRFSSDGNTVKGYNYFDFSFGQPFKPIKDLTNGEFYKFVTVTFGSELEQFQHSKLTYYTDLGANTSNTVTLKFNNSHLPKGMELSSATINLARQKIPESSGDYVWVQDYIFKFDTGELDEGEPITKNDQSISFEFNTDSVFTRFVSIQLKFRCRTNPGFYTSNYFILNDIVIQDTETVENQGFLSGLIDGILNALTYLGQQISGFFTDLANSIGGFFSELGNKISGFFSDLWNNLKGAFDSVIKSIGDFFTGIMDFLKSLFIPRDGFFDDKMQELQATAKEHLGLLYEIPEFVVNFIQSLISHISNAHNVTSFPYPAIEYQGYTLIPAGYIDFGYYISVLNDFTDYHFHLYDCYIAFTKVLASIWFINFCYKKLQVILGSDA